MSIERFRGEVEHMSSVAGAAGFSGFEPETIMLDEGWSGSSLRRSLDRSHLQLAALCLVDAWPNPVETDAERLHADRVIQAMSSFSEPLINLVHYPGSDRSDLRTRQTNALNCMKQIALRAVDKGIACSFHPNSPRGSVFRTADDYEFMATNLDPLIGFTPDSGHIAAGNMDPLGIIERYRDRVRYVHIKDRDANGEWARTGEGAIDIVGIVKYLDNTGYEGWVTFEDESVCAERAPDMAVVNAGRFVEDVLVPALMQNGQPHHD